MKKNICLILLCATMILMMSGCPKRYPPPDGPKEKIGPGNDKPPGPSVADFTLHAKCKNGKFVCGSDLSVEIVYGKNSHKIDSTDCSTIPVSFEYNSGQEKRYYVKMTASKGGRSETQGLSLHSVMESVDYPVVIYAFENWLCDCNDSIRPTNNSKRESPIIEKPVEPIDVDQKGPHWDEE